MADLKPIPPAGARLLAVMGQEDNFILWNYLLKQPVDGGWHNFQDFDRVLSNGTLVTATNGKKWLKATGFNGDQPSFVGNLYYEDRDVTWYDLPTEVVPIPAPISSLTATPVAVSEIDLAWVNPENAKTELERSENAAGPFVKIASLPYGFGYADKGLKANTQYFYRIRAVASSGNSDYSDVVTTMTQAPAPNPTPSPTPVNTVPVPVLSTTPTTTQVVPSKVSPTVSKTWFEQNQTSILIGGAVLAVLVVVLLIARRN